MKMEIVSEKFKYEKPQIEKVDLKLNQNVKRIIIIWLVVILRIVRS